MVTGEVVANLSDIISVLPPELGSRIGDLLIVLQAVGIAFVVYVAYLIVNFILNIKRYRKLNILEEKVDSVVKKLDRLLKKKKG